MRDRQTEREKDRQKERETDRKRERRTERRKEGEIMVNFSQHILLGGSFI